MQKEATPVIIAEDSFLKTIYQLDLVRLSGELEKYVFFTPLCICKRFLSFKQANH